MSVDLRENYVGDNYVKQWENQLRSLSSEIVNSGNRKIPGLLLKVQDMLEAVSSVSKEAATIRKLLWKYKFIQTIIIFLKRDYTMIDGGWSTAAKLSDVLSKMCIGIDFADSLEFKEESLPKAVNNMLSLALQIHDEYCRIPGLKSTQKTREDFCKHFRMVLESLSYLASAYIFLPKLILKSDLLLKLLMTDDSEMGRDVIQFIQNITRLDWNILRELDETAVDTIFDELIYKLSVYTDPKVGSAASRCVFEFCEHHTPLIDLLCTKYKGLRVLLSKLAEKGYRSELKPLLSLLNAGSSEQAIKEKSHIAAQKIQAIWRGYIARKRLHKINRSIGKFQRMYFKWKENKNQQLQEQHKKAWQIEQQRSELQQNMRSFHEKQLKKIEIVRAAHIQQHLYGEMEAAVICIQKVWKGYRERTKWKERQEELKRLKAAITIQRNVRKWLKTRKKLSPLLYVKPLSLTETRREELQQIINQWKEQRAQLDSVQHPRELQQKTNELLHKYYTNLPFSRKYQHHHAALQARTEIDLDLMLNAPKFQTITEKDIELYSSISLPIAIRAKLGHKEQLKKYCAPWWQSLRDDYLQNEESEEGM